VERASISITSRVVPSKGSTSVPPGTGIKAATIIFSRGDDVLREVWVSEGGEWGFERPGTGWTTGASPQLWKLVKNRRSR
jgi:hypothetical protein